MRKEGDMITWELAQRKGDLLILGKDLLDHLQNLFSIGAEERLRFQRAEQKKRGDTEPNLWYQQLSLQDKYAVTILTHAESVTVKLDGEGWKKLAEELSPKLEALNRKMMK